MEHVVQSRRPAAAESTLLSGVIVLDKPLRMSSASAVAIVRRHAEEAAGASVKTGHAGTLDPLATGVLLIALGKATKIVPQLMATDKSYQTTIDLGAFTKTDDLEGERSEVIVLRPPSEDDVRNSLRQFVGQIAQQPPAYSAMKINGERAYKIARQGQVLDLKPRMVDVHSIELLRYEWPLVELTITCGKGFYVRSLARDLGRALKTGGHCAAIRRTAVGPFTLAAARSIDALPVPLHQDHLISVEQSLHLLESQI